MEQSKQGITLTTSDILLVRKAHRLTLNEFCDVTGVSYSTISKIEQRRRSVSQKTSQKVCAAFEITQDKLDKIREFYQTFSA